MRNASSNLSAHANAAEQLSGLAQLRHLKSESNNISLKAIESLHKKIMENSFKKYFVTSSEERPEIEKFASENGANLLNNQSSKVKLRPTDALKNHHDLEGCQVNYVSLAFPVEEADYAGMRVLSHLMAAKFLHPMIRERGGAYGGGCVPPDHGSDLKTFRFFSYRDPANLDTVARFREAAMYILQKKPALTADWSDLSPWTETCLDEAKLRAFQVIDAPIAESSKGFSEFLHGRSIADDNEYRRKVLSVSKEDIIRLTEKYLLDRCDASDESSQISIIGPKEALLA